MGVRDVEELLPGCQYVSLTPTGFRDSDADQPIKYDTYFDVRRLHTDYQNVLDSNARYEDLMVGHPGHEGGGDFNFPRGSGLTFGIRDQGADWWLTNADGLTDSPRWTLRSTDPAVGDGTWFHDVRAPGKDITLTGTVVADSHPQMQAAADVAARALTVMPRTGWLLWRLDSGEERRLPVALAAPTQTAHVGRVGFNVQVTVKGVDIGTPGRGAYSESPLRSHYWTVSGSQTFDVGGGVPTSPIVEFRGQLAAGARWSLDGTDYAITANNEITEDDVLVVDCGRHTVTRWQQTPGGKLANGVPAMGEITLAGNQWPVFGPGETEATATFTTSGNGYIVARWAPLW